MPGRQRAGLNQAQQMLHQRKACRVIATQDLGRPHRAERNRTQPFGVIMLALTPIGLGPARIEDIFTIGMMLDIQGNSRQQPLLSP